MPIKIINLATAQFSDVNGVGRFLYGCPLSDRELLSESLSNVQQIVSLHPDTPIQELLLNGDFYEWVNLAAELCGLQLNWLINDERDLIYELMIVYPKNNTVYRGDIEALEFGYRYTRTEPGQPPLDLPKQTQFFNELWFYGCNNTLHKLTDLDVYDYERFKELSQLLINCLGEYSLNEAWDIDPLTQDIALKNVM